MTSVPSRRLDAVRAFGSLVASERGRKLLKRNGYSSDTPIIAADEDESVTSVMRRVVSAGSGSGALRVLLAVHYPRREKHLELVMLSPSPTEGSEHVSARGVSTIGMLVDAVAATGHSDTTFSVSSDVVASRFDMLVAGAN